MIYSVHLYLNFSRCLVLCRAWNKDHQVWRTLYLYFGDIRASTKFLISVGWVFCYQVRDFVCLPFAGYSDLFKKNIYLICGSRQKSKQFIKEKGKKSEKLLKTFSNKRKKTDWGNSYMRSVWFVLEEYLSSPLAALVSSKNCDIFLVTGSRCQVHFRSSHSIVKLLTFFCGKNFLA